MSTSSSGSGRPAGVLLSGVIAALVGVVAMAVLGFLTFGAQATAHPNGLPLAVAIPEGPAGAVLGSLAERIAGQGGDAVSWRVDTPAAAAEALADGEIYGYLQITPDAGGQPVIETVTSGASNPVGAQVADQVLRAAAGAIGAALAAQAGVPAADPVVTMVDPVSGAGRILPLAATALLWVGGLAAAGALVLRARQAGHLPARRSVVTTVAATAVLGPAVVLGFAALWDPGITWTPQAVGFLVLVAAAFAALQGAVLRLLGIAGLPILALLYLMAPSVVAQPAELLDPVYRALLWSWTPFRFATEPLRALLFAPDPQVLTGAVVFGALLIAGLVVIGWPRPGAATTGGGSAAERVVAGAR